MIITAGIASPVCQCSPPPVLTLRPTAVADQLRAQREQYSTAPPGRDGVELMVREYLSAAHRDNPEDGCPSAALLTEIGRSTEATRRAYTEGVLAIADEIAGRLAPDDPPSARGTTLSLFALLIGTLQLSRALADRELADEVLEQGIKDALALMDGDGPAAMSPALGYRDRRSAPPRLTRRRANPACLEQLFRTDRTTRFSAGLPARAWSACGRVEP
jgi:hypothetical protein